MTPKTRKKKKGDARFSDAEHKARVKRIDADLHPIEEMSRKMAPKLRGLKKFVNE